MKYWKKTTLLKLMAGFIKTTTGTVRIFGYDPFTHHRQVMQRARFAFAPSPIYGLISAFKHLKFLATAGIQRNESIGRVSRWRKPNRDADRRKSDGGCRRTAPAWFNAGRKRQPILPTARQHLMFWLFETIKLIRSWRPVIAMAALVLFITLISMEFYTYANNETGGRAEFR